MYFNFSDNLQADYYHLAKKFWSMPNTSNSWKAFNEAGKDFCMKYPGDYARDLFKALLWQILKNTTNI